MNSKQTVLVTGSSSGIGLSIAEEFKNNDWTVIQNSRHDISKRYFVGDTHIKADVTKIKDVYSLIDQVKKKYGHLNALVCNIGSGNNLENDNSRERWEHFLENNLLSATNLIDYALPLLEKSSVTVISSICGSIVIDGAPIEYSVSKSALNHYIKVMAKKYARKDITFNSVSPGNVLFEGSSWSKKIKKNKKEIDKYMKDHVPMGKFIEPKDIAEMVHFLASDKNRFITGQNIIIDGGQSL